LVKRTFRGVKNGIVWRGFHGKKTTVSGVKDGYLQFKGLKYIYGVNGALRLWFLAYSMAISGLDSGCFRFA
jgi:hypothetical protein